MLTSALDHLVVTAGTRAAGMAYVADALGVRIHERVLLPTATGAAAPAGRGSVGTEAASTSRRRSD